MINMYEINWLAIIDNGDGVFHEEDDMITMVDGGVVREARPSEEVVKGALSDVGISNLEGSKLSKIRVFAKQLAEQREGLFTGPRFLTKPVDPTELDEILAEMKREWNKLEYLMTLDGVPHPSGVTEEQSSTNVLGCCLNPNDIR